ncbi:MAG: hypothetical protein NPIRA02_01940 [Nitrospirales bacterium]|nr:MAG: hypothetical protein NPIRA02_01940 [Nitrospirales bacterium]
MDRSKGEVPDREWDELQAMGFESRTYNSIEPPGRIFSKTVHDHSDNTERSKPKLKMSLVMGIMAISINAS